tara:strand:+ start:3595 stop:5601 length:2007 start_codon:yes stop_codon:yes gene_type:complete
MASRSEITKDIQDLIGEGSIRDAYLKFEELPIVDQLAISFTPGIGDVLTAYEVGEFGTRAGESVQKGDLLGGLGYGALSALGVASFIPILRFIRAKKGIQPIVKSEPKLLEDSTKIEETVDAKIIPDFIQKDLDDLAYPNTSGLISPTRKFITDQVGNKLPETASVEKYISLLKKVGRGNKVTEGELRSLRVLDEVGDTHPQLKKQFGSKVISIEEFDQYLKKNQEGLFNFENVQKDLRHMPSITEDAASAKYGVDNIDLKDEVQKVYQVRNLEDLRLHPDGSVKNHYPDYDNVFAFDGVIDYGPEMPNGGNVRRTVSRIQSEYSKMLSRIVNNSGEQVFTTKADVANIRKKIKEINQEFNQVVYLRVAAQEKRNALKTLTKGSPEHIKTTSELKSLNQDITKITQSFADNSKFVSEYKMPTSFKNPELKGDIREFYKREFYSPNRLISTVPDISENLLKFVRASKEIKNPTFKGIAGNNIPKQPVSFKGNDKIRKGPFDDKAIAKTEIPTVRENIAAAVKDPKINELVFTSGEASRIRDGGRGFTYDFYDNRVFKQIEKVLKELDMEDNLIGKKLDNGSFAEGTYIKIDDAFRKAVEDKGISAFKDGGKAEDPRISKQMGFDELDEIERYLNELNIPFDYDKNGKLIIEKNISPTRDGVKFQMIKRF